MGKTYRKHAMSLDKYHYLNDDIIATGYDHWGYKLTEQEIARYYKFKWRFYKGDIKVDWKYPKTYRKDINRRRRIYDKREIYKAINFNDYPEQCSKWTCKDADPEWYF